MSNWLSDLFSTSLKKEAALETQETVFDKKIRSSEWLKEAMSLNEDELQKEAQEAAAEEARLLGKTAAYELGDTTEDTLKKDYERQVKILSDYSLSEMLAEYTLRGEGYPELFSDVKEKMQKYVGGNREEAEKKLLKLIGEHTMLDWKKGFEKFRDAKPTEPDWEKLYEPKPETAKQSWEKKDHDFSMPTDKERIEGMAGVGREENSGAVSKEIKSASSKEEVIKKVAEIESPWKVIKDENGQEVIARIVPTSTEKKSAEDTDDSLTK